jgi:hypothetical protein
VQQNFFEINTEVDTLCLAPGDCDTYTTWAMNAHAGDGVNDLKTDVQMTRGTAASGLRDPNGRRRPSDRYRLALLTRLRRAPMSERVRSETKFWHRRYLAG